MEKMHKDKEAGIAANDLIKPPEVFKKDEDWIPWSE
jgi:hypothetical protein